MKKCLRCGRKIKTEEYFPISSFCKVSDGGCGQWWGHGLGGKMVYYGNNKYITIDKGCLLVLNEESI